VIDHILAENAGEMLDAGNIRKAMQTDFDKKALSFSVNFYIDAIVESLQEVVNALEAKGK